MARVPAQVSSCGICGKQSGTGADFLLVLRFTLLVILPAAPHSSLSIIRGWCNRPSGRRTELAQSYPTLRRKASCRLHTASRSRLAPPLPHTFFQIVQTHTRTASGCHGSRTGVLRAGAVSSCHVIVTTGPALVPNLYHTSLTSDTPPVGLFITSTLH
jgi:hypothetical protein